jgi:protein-S-isoprenylcysteine O-methyltransferase Ste14
MIDEYLLVRGGSIYLAAAVTAAVWAWRRPTSRIMSGALLGFMWNLPILLALNAVAPTLGWWHFDAAGGLLLDVPVDLYLAWSWLWGGAAAMAFPGLDLAVLAAIAVAVDIALMPAAAPVVQLEPAWLIGEAVAVAFALVPGQLLARWTMRDDRLGTRVVLQMVSFAGLLLFVLPAIIIEASGRFRTPFLWSSWEWSLAVQLLAIPAVIGSSAVQEFVQRGSGTPVPFDPPRRLVTTGIYGYVRNPMQLSAVLLLVMLGLMVRNWWLAAAGVMAHVYSVGLAGWDEDADLRTRFGNAWTAYRAGVSRWMPSWRPWHSPDAAPPRLYVAESCGMCREVRGWFERRGVRHLEIVPAEIHPTRALRRITYQPASGGDVEGVEAIACALQHIHLGWALVGSVLRLPFIRPLAQLIADASGAQPRRVRSQVL